MKFMPCPTSLADGHMLPPTLFNPAQQATITSQQSPGKQKAIEIKTPRCLPTVLKNGNRSAKSGTFHPFLSKGDARREANPSGSNDDSLSLYIPGKNGSDSSSSSADSRSPKQT